MQSHPHNDSEPSPAPGVPTRRLEAFSDAVFAIAITLLALTFQVPALTTITPQALVAALVAHWPSYLSFVLSFMTLLIAWVYHHRLLQGVKNAGTVLLYTNGALLLIVSAAPFPTALLGAYLATPAASVVAAIYAGYIGLLNLSYNVLWWMVARPHGGTRLKGWRPPTSMLLSYLGFPCYLIAVALAFWSPAASLVICGALWILWTIMAPMPSAAQK
jgi:TMEM175 potassium channel family protein